MAEVAGDEEVLVVAGAGEQGLDFCGGLQALFKDCTPGLDITRSHEPGSSVGPNFIASPSGPRAPKAKAKAEPSPLDSPWQTLNDRWRATLEGFFQ